MTQAVLPDNYDPSRDERFLPGLDPNNPGSVGRAIAMQIRTVGHYQGQQSGKGACLIASAAYSAMSSDQRVAFVDALAKHLGTEFHKAGMSPVWWNDHTSTEDVVQKLESMPIGGAGD